MIHHLDVTKDLFDAFAAPEHQRCAVVGFPPGNYLIGDTVVFIDGERTCLRRVVHITTNIEWLRPGWFALSLVDPEVIVRGTLRITEQTPRPLVEAVLRETGELVTIPDPRPTTPTDPAQASRLALLAGLRRPETRPDDGMDRRTLHERSREIHEQSHDETSDLPLV